MEPSSVLVNLLLGGLLGLLGQGIRTLAGLKKLHDTTEEPLKENALFDVRRFWISLFLGFIAGGLGVVSFMDDAGKINFDKELIIRLIGIGYVGVDFIESFLSKYISSVPTGSQKGLSVSQVETTLTGWQKTDSFGIQNIVLDEDEVPPATRIR